MHTQKYLEKIMLNFLKKKTINKIRVNEIIQELGVCKGTFYKYYGDKYALLVESFQNNFYDDVCARATDWESFMLLCLEKFQKNSGITVNAFESNDVNSVRQYHEKLLAGYIAKDIATKGYCADTIDYRSIEICASSYTEIMFDWLKQGANESKEDIIAKMRENMPYSIYRYVYMKDSCEGKANSQL